MYGRISEAPRNPNLINFYKQQKWCTEYLWALSNDLNEVTLSLKVPRSSLSLALASASPYTKCGNERVYITKQSIQLPVNEKSNCDGYVGIIFLSNKKSGTRPLLVLFQRFDGARAKTEAISWHFSHGCHMATQTIISPSKKRGRQEKQKGATFFFLTWENSHLLEVSTEITGQNDVTDQSYIQRRVWKKRL